ncbi:MAG TPA: hypothetical protein VH327_08815, partial [Gammaproteobacteria bacterium]|nr:hypothetical protein [Gammaproteobacteria bacterium]
MKIWIILVLAVGNTLAADKVPVGPELAPPEIGLLLKTYPIVTQNNSDSPLGIGILFWGCDYLVGKAKITITLSTKPG